MLEARDLNHAIALMSKHPGVRFGPFEIRPADETIHAVVEKRNAAARAQGPAEPVRFHPDPAARKNQPRNRNFTPAPPVTEFP